MINFDDAKKTNKQTNKQTQAHDSKRLQIPDDLYRILIIGGWRS